MRDIAVTILVILGLIYTLKKPYIGILLWSWLGYMNPHRLSYGFAYTMPFAQVTAIITMMALLLSKEKKSFPITPLTTTWLFFILCLSISTLFAIFPEQAFEQLIKVLKIQLVVFLTLLLINDKKKLNQLIWVIALSIGFYSIKGGVFTLMTGGSFRVWGPSGTYIAGNNEIGLATLMIIPLFFYLRQQVHQKWLKNTLLAFAILSVFTVLGTQSRGAFLALGVISLFLWLKTSNKVITGVIGGIFIVLAISFMPKTFMDRMDTIETYQEDNSAMGRINAWTLAINIANDRFFAGGFNHWSPKTYALYAPDPDHVLDVHSIYFEVLGENGYPALILFLTLLFLTWRSAAWVIKQTKDNKELLWCSQLMKMIQVSLLAYCSGGAFLGLAYWDLPYHLISIVVITRVLVEQKLASGSTQKEVKQESAGIIEKKKWAWEK